MSYIWSTFHFTGMLRSYSYRTKGRQHTSEADANHTPFSTQQRHAPTHARTQSNKLPNLVTDRIHLTSQVHSQSPGISSNDAIPLSAKSSSGFWISFASSITFFAFNIFVFGIHDTGACSMIARAAVTKGRKIQHASCSANVHRCQKV